MINHILFLFIFIEFVNLFTIFIMCLILKNKIMQYSINVVSIDTMPFPKEIIVNFDSISAVLKTYLNKSTIAIRISELTSGNIIFSTAIYESLNGDSLINENTYDKFSILTAI